jgi:NADPH:quinone reductase-like Zn-dependent oxidoreductase
MKAWQIASHGSVDGLRLVDEDDPADPQADNILVRVRAVSVNYRDLTALKAPRPGNLNPLIPCSDAAGEVVSVGPAVTRWKPGDRITGCFFQDWAAGTIRRSTMKSALGGPIHGVLREFVTLRESAVVRTPDHLDDAEASTLPCAGLTAWHALVESGRLRPGESVLLLGTGGVSVFALQFANLIGARTIITSSTDEKLAQARTLGAAGTINHRREEDWEKRVYEMTGNEGVDHVVEVGGAGTLARSLASVRFGGRISLIGVLTGFEGLVNPWPIVARSVTVQGIYVGSTEMFTRMTAAVATNQLRPVVDRVFPFDEAPAAFAHLQSGRHFGKVVIAL